MWAPQRKEEPMHVDGTKLSVALLLLVATIVTATKGEAVGRLRFEEEFGGKGTGIGQFGEEIYLAFGSDGTIYVTDTDNRRVQRLGPTPLEIKPSEKVTFNHPRSLAVDVDGNIYVTDWRSLHIPGTENPKMYRFTPCIHSFDAEGRYLGTIDLSTPEIKPRTPVEATPIIDHEGRYALGVKPKGWDRELRVDVSAEGEIFVLDISYNRVLKIGPGGETLLEFGAYGSGSGELDSPQDFCVDGNGSIYVADTGNNRVVKFDPEGRYLLSFGRKGLGPAQFIRPFSIEVMPDGRVLVADEGEFERGFQDHPFSGAKGRAVPAWLDEDPMQGQDVGEEEEEKVEYPPKYVKVMRRIQVFSPEGRLLERVVFEIDRNNPELHDLAFLTLDSFGRAYLLDPSRHMIRRYTMESYLFPTWSEVEKAYGIRATKDEADFDVDMGDIDTVVDEESQIDHFTIKQVFSLNYDRSELLRLSLKNTNHYARRKDYVWDFDNPANDYRILERSSDSSVDVNIRYLLDPNRYNYREMTLFVKGLTGYTTYRGRATDEEHSKRRTRRGGDAKALMFGARYDLTRDANLSFGYSYIEPDQTSRNFSTYLYDTGGSLYYTDRHYNKRRTFFGEFMIKF
ncbi:MAG TPA: hypothetical protein EYP53_02440 [Candidatus Latescibacteria bacterium]|nr:hypothetical protein [Candidatus Latescibacterota bacterium]